MDMRLVCVIGILVVAAVVVMFAAPGIDLPRTALRAQRSADAIFAAIAFAAFTLLACVPNLQSAQKEVAEAAGDELCMQDVLSRTSVLIC